MRGDLKPATRPLATGDADAETLARALESHPDFRVLRRLVPRTDFGVKPLGPVGRVVIVDTETTGFDSRLNKIIELALLVVEVDTVTGAAVRVAEAYEALEDPGRPIPAEVSALTGITDDMVRGRKLDEARVAEVARDAQLVVAHNARFDRPFVEARLPAFARLRWACSIADIDWAGEGRGSSRLEYLAMKHGWFFDGRRAAADCHALLAVLNGPLPVSGRTGLARRLEAARATEASGVRLISNSDCRGAGRVERNCRSVRSHQLHGKAPHVGEKRHARYYRSRFLIEADRLVKRYRTYLLATKILTAAQIDRMKGTELFAELLMLSAPSEI
jgi:DNA polymerase III epsilon subunit-like protein